MTSEQRKQQRPQPNYKKGMWIGANAKKTRSEYGKAWRKRNPGYHKAYWAKYKLIK